MLLGQWLPGATCPRKVRVQYKAVVKQMSVTILRASTLLPCSAKNRPTAQTKNYAPKDETQLITISSTHSACILFMRRSGIFLRHFLIVAPLLSLNGKLGMALFCRLSSFRSLLFFMFLLFGFNAVQKIAINQCTG
jgi:hypothetical protein